MANFKGIENVYLYDEQEKKMNCRHCETHLTKVFVDLGIQPPSNSYLAKKDDPEKKYPLKVFVCHECYLVQTEDFVDREEMFSNEYAYFSSMSKSFLEHSKRYVDMITERLELDSSSRVVEIACNDGYLLQYFKEKGIYPIGVEPTASTAKVAREKDIHVVEDFFGTRLAEKMVEDYGYADLILGNNVLAHVPDINDFLSGVSLMLTGDGTCTFEFPHLLNLIKHNQFDTIYHEHYSYLSLTALVKIFQTNGLEIYDVEEIPTHGGSLRVYGQRLEGEKAISENVKNLLYREELCGMKDLEFYDSFQSDIEQIRIDFELFRKYCKERKSKVAGYGAAAKGNTFLNYVEGDSNIIAMVADTAPLKQGKFLPGSRIPIVSEPDLKAFDPDYVVIFPWNIKSEVKAKLRKEGLVKETCRFVTFIPHMEISQ